MGDFNGRINKIVRAFQQYPAGDINTRMIVRETLAAERQEGFQEGYNEGVHDEHEAQRSERGLAEREQDAATAAGGE